MQILKLQPLFFSENTHLVEVLDKTKGTWTGGKERGYGIVLISVNNLRFGIPVRTEMKHKFGYHTVGSKGLDYTKAVLLIKDEYISVNPFKISPEEYVEIKEKSHHIAQQFSKYVERYIVAVKKGDENILRNYRFSTLQNYHFELGL